MDLLNAAKKAEPTRTCVGCHGHEQQGVLVRLALSPDGSLTVDDRHRLGGRGAYVHLRARCVEDALRRGGLTKALRRPVIVTSGDLALAIRERLRQRAVSLLAAARKSRKAEAGTTAVVSALKQGRATLCVMTEDAAAAAQEVLAVVSGLPRPPRVVRFGTKRELGEIWERDTLAVIGITDLGLAEAFASAIEKLGEVCE